MCRVADNFSPEDLLLPAARHPRIPHHRLQLQDILLPHLALVLLAELFRQLGAAVDVFRADIVNGDLDRIGQVRDLQSRVSESWTAVPAASYLVSATSRNKNSLSRPLVHAEAANTGIFVQLGSESVVHIVLLPMDRVVVWSEHMLFSEEIANLIRILRTIDIPNRTSR